MTLLKHPTAGTIINVTGARAKTLVERGYQEVDADDADLARQAAASTGTAAVQPQPPIDARPRPPAPPIETRPGDQVPEPPKDARPPNPLGATSADVEDADGAGLDDADDEPAPSDNPPSKPASLPSDEELEKNNTRVQLNAMAAKAGVPEPDKLPNKAAVIDALKKAS